MVELKTGSVYALACRAGSRLVTDDDEALEQWGEFGLQLGVLVQIADDLQDIDPGSGANDLGSGQWNLAVAFAMDTATPSERLSLERDLQAARNDFSNLQALRSKILHSGAMLYLITEAERRRRRAEAALKAVSKPSPDRERLLELLNLAVSMRQP
jgi:geranylgeranyl diphosphate synthase type I